MPETEAAVRLAAIQVRPAQQIELADTPLAAVEQAIADGQARPGIRDLAGWVVYLLRERRNSGWVPAPPAPRPDTPEDLRRASPRYAAAQEAERRAGRPEDALCFAPEPARLNLPNALPMLWNEVQAALKAQLPRAEFALICHATLQSLEARGATVLAPNQTVKATLEDCHLSVLRDLIGLHVGEQLQVRVTLNPHAQIEPTAAAPRLDSPAVSLPPSCAAQNSKLKTDFPTSSLDLCRALVRAAGDAARGAGGLAAGRRRGAREGAVRDTAAGDEAPQSDK